MSTRQILRNISDSFRRGPGSTRKPKQGRVVDNDESRSPSGSQLEEAEQQRIMIGNLVKAGRLSVEEAMSFAESTGLTSSVKDQEAEMTYNFGVYKHTKDRSRTERYILQFDFNEQALSTIQKGKFDRKIPFEEIRDYDSEDDLRFFIYYDDGDVEYDADSAEEKIKICSLLDGIVSDNKNTTASGRLSSLPRARAATTLSIRRAIKEGQIEKRGHSAAFLTWSKRFLRIREGELAYYKVGEENMTALNIIKLGPGHAFIKKSEHNVFIVSTQKKEYSFRIINTNNSKDVTAIRQERDEWFTALSEALQPSNPFVSEIPLVTSPTLPKQDLLNTALEQQEFVRRTVESLQKELEQLMSIMIVVEAPIQATEQMRKVGEIVKTLDTQIKTGLLAWTMKSIVSMNCSPGSSTDSTTQRRHGNSLNAIPEQNGGIVDVSGGYGNANDDMAAPVTGGIGSIKTGNNGNATPQGSDVKPSNHVVSNHTITEDERSPGKPVTTNGTLTPTTQNSVSPPHSPRAVDPPPMGTPASLSQPDFVVPPPPSPGIGIPPPPPPGGGVPPPPPFGAGPASMLPPKPLVKPNVKVRPFFWSKVPSNLLMSSMWVKAQDRMNELDLKMIEDLFQIEEKANAPDLSQVAKKNASKSLLDNKRAQNLGIFLSGFKLTAEDVDRRLNFIDESDGGLPLEIVISLKRFQPSTEEAEMYKNYKGTREDLLKTDLFMMKLCEIRDLNARLDLLLFILEFPLQYEELSPTVSSVLQTCTDIIHSKKFQTVLEYVLAIGNYLNGGTSRGSAHGFQISSLPKLIDTRGSQKNYTLLNLLVDMLKIQEEETLSLGHDFPSMKFAVDASVKGLTAEVEVLWKGLAKIKKLNIDLQMKRKTLDEAGGRFHEDINTFVSEYELKLLDLNSRCDNMKESFTKMLTLLGEPSGKNSEEVFGNLNKFLTSFSSVIQDQSKGKGKNNNNVASPIREGRKCIKTPSKEQLNMNQMMGELKEKQVKLDQIEGKDVTKKQASLKRSVSPSAETAKSSTMTKSKSRSGSLKSPSKPTRQGTLQKLSGGKHKQPKWDFRHFELDPSGYLHYFRKAEGKVIDSIYLRGAPVSISEDDKCMVQIVTAERTYFLKTESEEEAISWKNDLAKYT
ncbi:formin-like protein 2 [Dendronephthya gigantea]|uniref:formin-like protein 2 n=1 Tax=Dendronephthya gigantea TaxID=151771 RepID=UPI00106B4C11|nr:formin-like protein 2 [Dendronephthya gigantea]